MKDGEPLYCLVPDGDKKASVELLGTFKSDGVVVASSASPQAGRPIFIVNKKGK